MMLALYHSDMSLCTPYLLRMEHLNILGMSATARVADWYARCQQRPSFETALRNWENADYFAVMQCGARSTGPRSRP